jgi:hypothetical protein
MVFACHFDCLRLYGANPNRPPSTSYRKTGKENQGGLTMTMNVYLDDNRLGPNSGDGINVDMGQVGDWYDWVIVRSVANVQDLLVHGLVNDLSLDHDMGDDQLSGYDLVNWMIESGHWPNGDITVHSRNPVGAARINAALDNYFRNVNGGVY